jgi:hypothetical protein
MLEYILKATILFVHMYYNAIVVIFYIAIITLSVVSFFLLQNYITRTKLEPCQYYVNLFFKILSESVESV